MTEIKQVSEGQARYYIRGTVRYPSVTTVLDRMYNPAFAHATNVAKEATELGRLIETGELRRRFSYVWNNGWELAFADYNPLELLKDEKYMKGAALRRSGEAMDRGTICDRFVKDWHELKITARDLPEYLDGVLKEGRELNGEPCAWRCEYPEVMPHLRSAYKFLSENEVKIAACDLRFLSNALRCGGEADALGSVNGENYLMEFKTSSAPTRAHAVQVCTYKAGLKLRGIPCMVVCFTKDGYRAVVIKDEKSCLQEWRRLRNSWDFEKADTPWETLIGEKLDVFDLEAI